MSLITPDIGLLFWMLLSFSIVLFILKKLAWKPILKSINDRENTIEDALKQAEKAKLEMANLKSDNEELLKKAREERDLLLKEARDAKMQIIGEAKTKAKEEGDKMLKIARESIENEKLAAITELKNQVAGLSIDIAEKILKAELSAEDKQKKLINNLLEDLSAN